MLGVGQRVSFPVNRVGCCGRWVNGTVLRADALIPHVLLARRSANLQGELQLGSCVHRVDNRTANRVRCGVQVDAERAAIVHAANALGQCLLVEMWPTAHDRTRR